MYPEEEDGEYDYKADEGKELHSQAREEELWIVDDSAFGVGR